MAVDHIRLQQTYAALHAGNIDYQTNNWLVADMDEILHLCDPSQTMLLEIGCGNGIFALKATEHFNHVTATDWAPSPVILAKAARIPNLSYKICDVVADTLPQAGIVVSADVLEHFAPGDMETVIRKLSDAGPLQWHNIACYPDSRELHLTVQEPEAWLAAFQKIDPSFVMASIRNRRNRPDQPVVTIARCAPELH